MDNRIFVGNLPWDVGYQGLKDLFSSYGEITDAIVMSDKHTGRSRGFGFITFKDASSVAKAITEMNQKNIEGRELKVTEAPKKERIR